MNAFAACCLGHSHFSLAVFAQRADGNMSTMSRKQVTKKRGDLAETAIEIRRHISLECSQQFSGVSFESRGFTGNSDLYKKQLDPNIFQQCVDITPKDPAPDKEISFLIAGSSHSISGVDTFLSIRRAHVTFSTALLILRFAWPVWL